MVEGIIAGSWCVQLEQSEPRQFEPSGESWNPMETLLRNLLATSYNVDTDRNMDPSSTHYGSHPSVRPGGQQHRCRTDGTSGRQQRGTHRSGEDVRVHTGDVCKIILPLRAGHRTIGICVFIAAMVRFAKGELLERLVWIRTSYTDGNDMKPT